MISIGSFFIFLTLMYSIYQFLLYCSLQIVKVLSFFKPKIESVYKGKRKLIRRFKKQIPQDKTVFWFHCASLGEYEQGRPLIERIRLLYPDFFVLLTFYSPSGYDVVKNENNAHYVSYIPFDFKKQVKTFLDIVQPEIAVFVKYEFWPVLMNQLNKREVKVYLVAGIFRANQIFFKPYGAFMRNALQAFDHFFVQDVHSEKLLKK